jgi:hypothetical protein
MPKPFGVAKDLNMGRVKDWWIREQAEKQRAWDEMPETLAQCYELIDDLQTEVQNLKKQINENNTVYERYKSYIIGGLIGAVISFIIGVLMTLL